jgi:salicylate hydroxylase
LGKDAVRLFIHDVHRAGADTLQFFLVYPISDGKYVNFAGFTLQPDLVATAYEANAGNFRPSFQGKANNEWVGELTAEQLVQPFKNFEEDAQPILEVCHIAVRIRVFIPHWAFHRVYKEARFGLFTP